MINEKYIIKKLKSTRKYTEVALQILKDTIEDLKKICKLQRICIGILLVTNIISCLI